MVSPFIIISFLYLNDPSTFIFICTSMCFTSSATSSLSNGWQ